jgi:hypothetical protein
MVAFVPYFELLSYLDPSFLESPNVAFEKRNPLASLSFGNQGQFFLIFII